MQCEVAPDASVVGLQATATEVMVDEDDVGEDEDFTARDWVPDMAVFWALVAVMVTFPAEAGAVKRPLVVMVPALADHFTAEL